MTVVACGDTKQVLISTPRHQCAPLRTAWHATETIRGIYDIDSPALALQYTLQLADDLQDQSCPPEINKLGRTIACWTPQITNWHISPRQPTDPPNPSTT